MQVGFGILDQQGRANALACATSIRLQQRVRRDQHGADAVGVRRSAFGVQPGSRKTSKLRDQVEAGGITQPPAGEVLGRGLGAAQKCLA